ncbi:MAG: ATP phosphoribosyltransferase regulatory subunit [Oceanococcaceae bacterium]
MHWLLPDGVEEWLPPDSWRLDALRRDVLDVFARHGFDLILPPVLEYTESLHSGVGKGLERKTFTLVDQHNGRQLGFRADITPQAARIDANRYAQDAAAIRRLCYLGTVLRTHSDALGGPRSLRQLGAEVFGSAGLDADIEVITLMCAVLESARCADVTLDLGHVGIVRAALPGVSLEAHAPLLAAVQRKAPGEVTDLARAAGFTDEQIAALVQLCGLHGTADTLRSRRDELPEAMHPALDELLELSERLAARFPAMPQHLDAAELSGFHYETGVTWAAYRVGQGQAIARGGRYDGIGRVFGVSRPATGFSADLNVLYAAGDRKEATADSVIWAPADADPELHRHIAELRGQGRCVRQVLPGESMGEGPRLQRQDNQWTLN